MAEQAQTEKYCAESDAVRAHLSILQAIIQRMAGNSVSCKTQCIVTLGAALLVLVRAGLSDHAWIVFMPGFLFLFLDMHYLALERAFRGSYDAFVGKLHKGEVALSDLYVVKRDRIAWWFVLQNLLSFAILPFYGALFIMIALVWKFA